MAPQDRERGDLPPGLPPQDPFPFWALVAVVGLILVVLMVACLSSICVSPTGSC